MSDIDFDELDRAVNGALNGTPVSSPAPVPTPAEERVDTSETPVIEPIQRTSLASSRASAPIVASIPEPTQPPISTPAPTPVVAAIPTVAPRPSSGRFMDLVHPSSDMRTTSTGPSPIPAPVEVRQEVEPVTEPTINESPAWNEPLESPFLPDTKVEKRPLGGVELLEAPEPQELLEEHTMPDPIDFAHAQVVTEEIVPEPTFVESPKVEEPVYAPEPIAEVESQVEAIPEQPEVIETPAPTLVEEPVGPTSITQQYREQASSNQESGAIFDTESYHQPVTQLAKKKSSLFTIIWIVLLVVLGAAAGWAVYTFVLPML